MSTLAMGAMVLAGTMSTGDIPLVLNSTVHANGAWVTAADVVRISASNPRDLLEKLSKIKLTALRGCADVVLSQSEVARRIASQLPGVFALGAQEYAGTTLLVKVDGQTLDSAQLAAGIEQSVPRNCPSSMRENCGIWLMQQVEGLCVPRGRVEFRADVTEAVSGAAPLQVRVDIRVNGVHSITLRLPATPVNGLWAMQIKSEVALGQAIRMSDVEPVQVSAPVPTRTRYDGTTRVVRATSGLAVGDFVRADVVKSLAVGRVHEPVLLSTQVGPVQVSRAARLASDVGRDSNTWAYFEDGGLAIVGPVSRGAWELIR